MNIKTRPGAEGLKDFPCHTNSPKIMRQGNDAKCKSKIPDDILLLSMFPSISAPPPFPPSFALFSIHITFSRKAPRHPSPPLVAPPPPHRPTTAYY
ncbi:hypothetical protein E2C01_088461 [Portunus trituberculatus]|uniref:Uncharacterized protein n=1 Tax=Portunus trituberculatus TaxID=210409 RepID=A0A5B7JJF9_PORTR|nr:hypothetical protein [Portunus trituberculatus]